MPAYDEKKIQAKETLAKVFKTQGKHAQTRERLPPGQFLTQGFPILDLGVKPEIDMEQWRLKISGLVKKPCELSLEDLKKLGVQEYTKDFHCLAPGTIVLTNPNAKKIEDIKVGDYVIGIDGKKHLVKKLVKKYHTGNILRIKAAYLPEVSMTPDHKVLIIRGHKGVGKSKSKRRKYTFIDNPLPSWVPADQISTGDYVFFPKYRQVVKNQIVSWKEHTFNVDKLLAFVLGWYVSEGYGKYHRGNDQIRFALNIRQSKEAEGLSKILSNLFKAKTTIYRERNMNIVVITSTKIRYLSYMLKDWCGEDAFSKRIPDFILNSECKILQTFLQSLIEGDGYCAWRSKKRSLHSRTDLIDITTASKNLAYQLVLALSKINIPAKIVNHPGSVRDAYSVRITGFDQIKKVFPKENIQFKESLNRRHYWETKEGFYYTIKKIEKLNYSGLVYDFTAEGLTMLSPFVTLDCVTTWSKFDVHWTGIPFEKIIAYVQPDPSWKYLIQYGKDGYSTNVTREDLEQDTVFLAFALDGKPIPREHGYVRLIIPHLYAWKTSKFLTQLEFSAVDKPGFWEVRGYHNRGDAFQEERYS